PRRTLGRGPNESDNEARTSDRRQSGIYQSATTQGNSESLRLSYVRKDGADPDGNICHTDCLVATACPLPRRGGQARACHAARSRCGGSVEGVSDKVIP